MIYNCPKCSGVIYNRRNKICGFCGAELPAELLFTAEEIATLDKKERDATEHRRKDQSKKDAEEQERHKTGGASL